MINHSTAYRFPKFIPFQEPVTYFSRTANDSGTNYNVGRARRKKVDKSDKGIPQNILPEVELMWQIVADYLLVEPKIKDEITDSSGVGWVVIAVVEQFNGVVYNLMCRRKV